MPSVERIHPNDSMKSPDKSCNRYSQEVTNIEKPEETVEICNKVILDFEKSYKTSHDSSKIEIKRLKNAI